MNDRRKSRPSSCTPRQTWYAVGVAARAGRNSFSSSKPSGEKEEEGKFKFADVFSIPSYLLEFLNFSFNITFINNNK